MNALHWLVSGVAPGPTVVGWFVLYTFKVSAVLILAHLAVKLMHTAGPFKRSLVLRLAVASVLALPLIGLIVPVWNVGIFGSVSSVLHSSGLTVSPALTDGAVTATPGMSDVSVTAILFTIWLIGVGVVLVRILLGAFLSIKIVRGAQPAGTTLNRMFDQLKVKVNVGRSIGLVISSMTSVPYVAGIFRPTIVLPASSEQWTADNARMVLTHELAHIKRYDVAWVVLTSLAVAIQWFNPLVWLVRKRLHIEAEQACDDYVINAGTGPIAYAEHLLNVAREAGGRRILNPLGAGMAKKSQLEGRLMSVLRKRVHAVGAGRALAATVIIVAAAIVVPLACLQAGADENPSPTTTDQQTAGESSESLPGPTDFVAVEVMPEMIKTVDAEYPEEAKKARDSGVVYIKALIDKTGKVRDVRIGKSSGYKILDDAAVKAAWQCEFKPASTDNKPVATWIMYSVHFSLADRQTEE